MLVFAAVTRKLAVISGWPWPGVSSAAVESSAATNTVHRTDREVEMSPWEVRHTGQARRPACTDQRLIVACFGSITASLGQ
jgi:hypothetical protein